jgi:hypothetical protein
VQGPARTAAGERLPHVWSSRGWLLLTSARTSAYIGDLTTIPFSSLIMAEIEIFLSTDEIQMSFLSIPCSDIERLAVYPFQWIRYVMFAICGARGDLCTTPNGPAVDYETPESPMTQIHTTIGLRVGFLLCVRLLFTVSRLLQVLVPL